MGNQKNKLVKKKLLLINPNAGNGKFTFNEPLSLGILSALTPSHYIIELIDENFEDFEVKDCDLVAITATTASVNRAYRIASDYKKQGIPTIIGGVHASLNPDEASGYFTSVVIGDAENVWKLVISDFENKSLKKTYRSANQTRYIQEPDRKIFEKYKYPAHTVETSRGCIFDCDFCCVSKFHEKNYFERPINELLNELKKLKNKIVFFSDDNFIGRIHNKQRLLEILKLIANLNLKWYAFSSINIFYHQDILLQLKLSGCKMLHIGFESDDVQSLIEVKKSQNIHYFNENKIDDIVNCLHSFKISVMGGFIYGFDSDDPIIMRRRLDRIKKSKIDWFTINLLTPLPGSNLYNKFLTENRIQYKNYPKDWEHYNFSKAVFNPQKMSIADLNDFFSTSIRAYDNKLVTKRFFSTLLNTKSLTSTYYIYLWVVNHWANVRKNKIILLYLKTISIILRNE